MNDPFKSKDFVESQSKPSLLQRLMLALATFLSSPKGDQGGWEGGARGL